MRIDFDETTKRALQQMIRKCLPDSRMDDDAVTRLALSLWLSKEQTPVDLTAYGAQLDDLAASIGLTLSPREDGVVITAPAKQAPGQRFYDAYATHMREIPSGRFDPFTGHLMMARITLPGASPQVIETRIGDVQPGDHYLATVAEANQEYAETLGYPLERVDLITPPRFHGARFGAISVYLGYRDPTSGPCCYVLEAGTVTGEASVLYLGKTLDTTIVKYAGYTPTPFSRPNNIYTGHLTMAGDSPEKLTISSRRLHEDGPYIHIEVSFSETMDPDVIWPGSHTLRALSIVIERSLAGVKP